MFLKELSELHGVSGDETRVRNFIREKLMEMGIKNFTDSMGNLFAVKEGQRGTRDLGLMISAHMDEVGLMVSSVEKSGHLRFYKVGGIEEKSLVSKPVRIGRDAVHGVIGAKAIHLQKSGERKKALTIDELYIDIGAKNKEEAEKAVKPGDFVSFATEAETWGDIFKGKALDDRAGCAALLELLGKDTACGFTAAFTVQEEVGARGARAAAFRIDPQMALIIETTLAVDVVDIKKHDQSTVLGQGPAFTLQDESVIAHPRLLERLIEVAGETGKPYQFRRYAGNFTDAGAVSRSRGGVMTGVISTPCRYIHTPASLINLGDLNGLIEITEGFIRSVAEKGLV
jgi:endoglucanase